MSNCLVITDIQNDFCLGGALALAEGDKIVPVVNASRFDKCVATQDWHPFGHVSFASTHDKRSYEIISVDGIEQVLWPDHCVPGTLGADFHKDLDLRPVDLIIRKGNDLLIDSYSTFLENDKKTATGLHYYLQGWLSQMSISAGWQRITVSTSVHSMPWRWGFRQPFCWKHAVASMSRQETSIGP